MYTRLCIYNGGETSGPQYARNEYHMRKRLKDVKVIQGSHELPTRQQEVFLKGQSLKYHIHLQTYNSFVPHLFLKKSVWQKPAKYARDMPPHLCLEIVC